MLLHLQHIIPPLVHDILDIINSGNKGFDECLLATQLRTCIHRFTNRYQNFLILTMAVMILLHKHKDIVDINLNLFDQFYFKYNIIGDVCTLTVLSLPLPFITKVLIPSKIILEVSFRYDLLAGKIIEGYEQVSHTKD